MSASQLQARRLGARPSLTAAGAGAEQSDDSLHLHVLTIGLALLAGVIFSLVKHNESGQQHLTWCITEILIQLVVVIIGSWLARKHLNGSNSSVIPPLMVLTITLTLVWEPIQRSLFRTGHPLEELVMLSQANLMLTMAICGFRRGYRQLCAVVSVFLVIFCLTKATGPLVIGLFSMYAILGVVWLVASYWDQVSRRILADSKRRLPLVSLIGIPLAVLGAILFFGGGPTSVADRLRGFVPWASGGDEDQDDYANSGIKDGDGLVAGQDNIQTFGPIEDAPFADDDKPSLYDVFDDSFDPPPRNIKKTERAIALPPDQLAEIQNRMARSKQAGREFSTIRRKTSKKTGDRTYQSRR